MNDWGDNRQGFEGVPAVVQPGELIQAPAPPPFIEGAFFGMPWPAYNAVEAMSFGGSGAILRSPKHFRLFRTAKRTPPTDAQLFGLAVHALCEGGQTAFDRDFAIAHKVDRRTKAGRAEYAAMQDRARGRNIIDVDAYQRAILAANAINEHPRVAKLFEGAESEVSIFWIDREYKVPCKARLDRFKRGPEGGIGDYKTYSNVEAGEFARQVARMGYLRQAAHYWSGCEHVFEHRPTFYCLIGVEDEDPHGCAAYTLPPVALAAGRREMDEALARYADALLRGTWNGYDDRIRDLQIPRWALRHEA